MNRLYYSFLILCCLFFYGCKDDSLSSGNFKLPLRSIDQFEINPAYNIGKIDEVFSADINEDMKTIELHLPMSLLRENPDAEYFEFTPMVKISRAATVTPKSLEPIKLSANPTENDFIEYTVVSEDGRTAIYTLTWKYDFAYKDADVIGYEFISKNGDIKRIDVDKAGFIRLPQSWFTYDDPIQKDDLGNQIGQIKMRIILTPSSKNATIDQPEKTKEIFRNQDGEHYYYMNPTRLSLTEPAWVDHYYGTPLYRFSVISDDRKTTKTYQFSLNWTPGE